MAKVQGTPAQVSSNQVSESAPLDPKVLAQNAGAAFQALAKVGLALATGKPITQEATDEVMTKTKAAFGPLKDTGFDFKMMGEAFQGFRSRDSVKQGVADLQSASTKLQGGDLAGAGGLLKSATQQFAASLRPQRSESGFASESKRPQGSVSLNPQGSTAPIRNETVVNIKDLGPTEMDKVTPLPPPNLAGKTPAEMEKLVTQYEQDVNEQVLKVTTSALAEAINTSPGIGSGDGKLTGTQVRAYIDKQRASGDPEKAQQADYAQQIFGHLIR
jgi:hypothetical protein